MSILLFSLRTSTQKMNTNGKSNYCCLCSEPLHIKGKQECEISPAKRNEGSLKWIQVLINKFPDILNRELSSNVDWLSPVENDEYAEYRDSDFLELLGLSQLKAELKQFWPQRGPQWDALGRSGDKILLIEAKANIPEVKSICCAKSPKSIKMIENAFQQTRTTMGISQNTGWLDRYYQYANRLAHLHFFLNICGIEAELVFIYFCNDQTHIPTTVTDWKTAIADQKREMGVPTLPNVTSVYIDCQALG